MYVYQNGKEIEIKPKLYVNVCYNLQQRTDTMYRLKIVTPIYMKLWVSDNLVLFLYHSGINCSLVYEAI